MMQEQHIFGVEIHRANLLLRGLLQYVDRDLAFAMDLAAFESEQEPETEHWQQVVSKSVEDWIKRYPELGAMPIMFSIKVCPEGCHILLSASPEFNNLLGAVGLQPMPAEDELTFEAVPLQVISPTLH